MGRLLMGLLLLAVLAGLCWLWSMDERAAAERPPRAEAATGSVVHAAELAAPEIAARAPAAETPRRELAPALAPELEDDGDSRDVAGESDDLRVLVVDPAGKPLAGIPLRLERGAGSADGVHVPGALVTDASGRALFAGIRRALESAAEPWTLVHPLPFAEPPELSLDRAALAGPEVVSRLPWGGALEVVVREIDGAIAPEKSSVKLRLLREEELQDPVPSGPEWERELGAVSVSFPWIELGRTWDVSAWRPEGFSPSRKRVQGPSRPEERMRVEIVLGADHPVVSFRAVDARGAPLASATLKLGRHQAFGFAELSVETDALGRFTLDGDTSPFRGADFLLTHEPASGGALQGRASLPDSLQDGWNDGGDVVLEGEPLLCAGRVVDEGGQPVPGAEVVAGPDDHGWFQRDQNVRSASDEQGRFELRGLWREDEFDLHAEQHWPRSQHPGRPWLRPGREKDEPETGQGPRRSDTLRARQGQRDVVLVLAQHYTLSGRLRVDPGVDAGAIRFQLEAPGEDPVSVDRRRGARGDDGGASFVLQPVRRGEYELRCLLEERGLARVGGIVLQSDLQLGEIDLGGRIQVCEILLHGAEDPAKLGGELTWKPHGSDERHGGRIEGNRVRILTPTLPIDVTLRPRGYRHVELENVSGPREVALEAALHVRIVLDTDGEFPEPPYLLKCYVSRADVDVSEPRGAPYLTREDREVELSVSATGPLRVCWGLERRVEGAHFGGAMGSGVLGDHQVEIVVLDVPGEQVFPVRLDGAALTELAHEPPW